MKVFPANLTDQFQFSGRLNKSLLASKAIGEIAIWSIKNPSEFCVVFTKNEGYHLLKGSGIARQYSNGWLIFRPVKDFITSYRVWITQSTKKTIVSDIEIKN